MVSQVGTIGLTCGNVEDHLVSLVQVELFCDTCREVIVRVLLERPILTSRIVVQPYMHNVPVLTLVRSFLVEVDLVIRTLS